MIEIVTDSGCDLHESQFAGLPVTFVPLNVSIGDESFDRDNPISPVEFYRRLSETLQFPKTSQAAIGDFVETYRTIAARGSEILINRRSIVRVRRRNGSLDGRDFSECGLQHEYSAIRNYS